MVDDYGAVGGMRMGRGKPKYAEKTCPQRHFIYHKSHMTSPGLERGPPWWEAGLSYGTALRVTVNMGIMLDAGHCPEYI
jgi:hypothetical protein